MRRSLLSFLLLPGILAASASKLVFLPIATQTEDGVYANAYQPVPTAAPELYASTELLKRQDFYMDHDTCGFGAIDPGLTYRCYSSVGTCENIGSFRGCCTSGLSQCSSTFWTQCDDYDLTSLCGLSSKTRCCHSALPYCITWLFSTSDSTVTALDCDTQSRTRVFELLATPLSLLSNTSSSTTNNVTTPSSTLEITSQPSTTANDPAVTSSSEPATTSPEAVESSNSGAPIGAIVGGVVGGIAGIGLVALGIFCLLKRNRRGGSPSSGALQSPPPPPPGPQELAGSGYASVHAPPQAYHTPSAQSKYHTPMVETPFVEAPNTPAIGTGYNRAELG
ncbi:hypothetical protein GGS23DRAFT_326785 [Durotheca rogersii]|uniref:uncharacterized protein n=1 Tax=Durotheca rogersii TaxID=419775 RepID=UPI00221F85D7|nr:uncharacterized protein GGS23DRAFT_326785 [Durotheca rogersii]KAI5859253.1 hypothetical protein GGS23DRAFT_326785 [Durotheca rogersii]